MKKVEINLYSFEELNKVNQANAIQNHYECLDETKKFNEEAFDKAFEKDLWEYAKNDLEKLDFLFYADGRKARVAVCVGKHSDEPVQELVIGNDIYIIKQF